MKHFLAIDIGASSGRHILGHVEDGRIVLEEVYRFDNSQVVKDGHDCWDIPSLFTHIVAGIKAAGDRGTPPETIGIDTWGVDFVLLGPDMKPCSDTVAYRDSRTVGADRIVEESISQEELYSRCGIQKAAYNTIYQLAALKKEHPDQIEAASRLLMTPEYLNFLLTGVAASEYTICSTTGLVNARTATWDDEVIARLALPRRIFGEIKMPGSVLGPLLPSVRDAVGFDSTVVLAASHDTGSAYLAVPAKDDNAVYISSGTWSLLGVENMEPVTSEASRRSNFSNEGGAWRRYRYLKNIMGLWMIQSVRRELNGVSYVAGKGPRAVPLKDWTERKYSFDDLEKAARASSHFKSLVDVSSDRFLSPESMIAEVRAACAEAGEPVPETVGELMQTVYASLAECYRLAIANLEGLTGKKYTSINIVGGGSKDGYLNELTRDRTGLKVYAGPTEGTAIGNLIVQMIAAGEFSDLAAARAAIAR